MYSGNELQQLQQALLSAYDPNSLAQMVRFELDERLDQIVDDGNFADKIFGLITWAERQGRLQNLLEAAIAFNTQNPQLNELVDSLLQKPSASAGASALGASALGADDEAPLPSAKTPKTAVAIEWCHVSAGPFYMGSTPQQIEETYQSAVKKNSAFQREWFEAEGPQRLQYMQAYFISRTSVTNAQFAQFVNATSYVTTAEKEGSASSYLDGKWQDVQGANWQHPTGPGSTVKIDHPVVCVSWHDATAFCQWAGLQLPSEAQWEKAARGTDGWVYPWGDDPPTKEHCNFNMHVKTTTSVGSYPKGASPYGCLDMAGNVLEWTSTLYKPYPYTPNDGRENQETDGLRTCRGGSFDDYELNVRCAFRNSSNPDLRYVSLGFRVVSPGAVGI